MIVLVLTLQAISLTSFLHYACNSCALGSVKRNAVHRAEVALLSSTVVREHPKEVLLSVLAPLFKGGAVKQEVTSRRGSGYSGVLKRYQKIVGGLFNMERRFQESHVYCFSILEGIKSILHFLRGPDRVSG